MSDLPIDDEAVYHATHAVHSVATMRIVLISCRPEFIQRISGVLNEFCPDFLIPSPKGEPACLITPDTGLVVVDGQDLDEAFEVTRRIRSGTVNRRVPVIVAGYSTQAEELIRRIFCLGQTDVLHEPIDMVILREKAANFLEVAKKDKTESLVRNECVALKTSNDELADFAYLTAHDLLEPLRGLVSYLQLLRERAHAALDERTHGYLNRVVSAAEHMRALIHSALEFATSTSVKLELVTVDIKKLLMEVLDLLEPKIKMSDSIVSIGPMPTIVADRAQIQRVFQNLIANGINYNDSKPPMITISSRDTEHDWVFSIRDNGIGVPECERERIFLLFQRGHADKKSSPGSGIGLTICKKIVECHHGRIWIEANSEGGSLFSFSLPKKRDSDSA